MTPWEKTEVITAAIKSATEKGYSKPGDIAIHIKTQLDLAGLTIVAKPKKKG